MRRNAASHISIIAPLLLASLLVLASPVHSDTSTVDKDVPLDAVMVRGQTLHGQIIGLDSRGIRFKTVYGEGEIKIPYDDIEGAISSRATFRIVYGDDKVVVGRLLGLDKKRLLVGETQSSIIQIPVQGIGMALLEDTYQKSFWKRLKTNYRHWRADFDIGLKYEESTIDKKKIELGLNVARRKRPTRFVFDFRYAYEVEQLADQPEITTKDEFTGILLGEYDIAKRFYIFVQPAAERDLPRLIKLRTYPTAGIGYRLVEKGRALIQFPVGLGYVSEDFTVFGTNSYTGLYLGAEGSYTFNNGMRMMLGLLWIKGFSDPDENRLFRGFFEFAVPIVEPIAIKLRITETNDDNPAPEVGDNKLTATLAVSLQF